MTGEDRKDRGVQGADRRPAGPARISLFACPECGRIVEFWPDEMVRRCSECGCRIENPEAATRCMDSCPHAAQCMEAMGAGVERKIAEAEAAAEKETRKNSKARS